jgi:hypothetical protein
VVKASGLRQATGEQGGAEMAVERDLTGWLGGTQPDADAMVVLSSSTRRLRGDRMGGRREMKLFAMR